MGSLDFRAMQLWAFGRCWLYGLLALQGVSVPCKFRRIFELYGWNYPACPSVWLKLPSTPFCTVEITQHALLYGWNYPACPSVRLKLPSMPYCTVEFTLHALLYGWIYPACPSVRLKLPYTPFCMVEITQHALKGQKLLAQGNALGINDIQLTPCKGKSFTYRRGFSIFIRCILKLLPLQGASLNAFIPRALPWARSFCPFRACCLYGLLGLQGASLIALYPGRCLGLRASALSGRAAVGYLIFRALLLIWASALLGRCCCGLLDL